MREIGFGRYYASNDAELGTWPSDQCLEEHCGVTIHIFVSCARARGKGGRAKQTQRPEPVSAKLETTAELGFMPVESAAERRCSGRGTERQVAKTPYASKQ